MEEIKKKRLQAIRGVLHSYGVYLDIAKEIHDALEVLDIQEFEKFHEMYLETEVPF